MDQKLYEVEETGNILPVAKSCSDSSTPTKNPLIHQTPHVDALFMSPTPKKTEETLNNRCKKEPAKLSEKQAMVQKLHEVEEIANMLPAAHNSCSELFTPTKNPHSHEIPHFDTGLVSPALEKTETVNDGCEKELTELPEKYKLLSELFDRMTTSLRLLDLRKQLPTFQNIRRAVEALTWRKFTYKNLAQIKFILPEVVQTDKILLHNKKTLCMEPDIKVTLLFDVIEGHNEHSDYLALSRLISSRLFKFVSEHSEDYDVPEAELPELFNRKEITISVNSLSMNSPVRILPNFDETEPLNPSHLPPTFKRHFSAKEFKTKLSQSSIPSSPIKEISFSSSLDPVKQEKALKVADESTSMKNPPIKEISFSSSLDPVQQEKALKVADENTPMKNPLVINEIIVETPDMSTPRRLVATEDNKPKNTVNQKTMGSSLFVKRTLKFSSADEENTFLNGNVTSDSGPSAKY